MGKSSNPVDAHRKAQRKAELKKNKQKREQSREVATVKKDTRPLEADIRRLSAQKNLSKADKDELAQLRAEVARINKAKHDYVEAHPEHRKFVFPDRPEDAKAEEAGDNTPGLYDKNGRLKHPERSLYYDPVYNPYGAPPPGMPYREKPEFAIARLGVPSAAELAAFQPVVDAAEEDDSDDEDEDDDIAMPEGPPPAPPAEDDSDADSDDSDGIQLPPGPPPPRPAASSFFPPSQPHALPPRPNFPPPQNAPSGPRNPHQQRRLPARPAPPGAHMQDPLSEGGPNRAYQQGAPPRSFGPEQPPPPPPAAAAPPSGPSPFLQIPGASAASTVASGGGPGGSATISAAPQLRDFKKEATAFVPAAMRKKMAQQKAQLAKAGLGSIDAARGVGGEEGAQVGQSEGRKSLLDEMRERGIGVPGGAGAGAATGGEKKPDAGMEDYERFRAEMGSLL
ncbi:hypothetical protein Rhopal_000176-T1 [Rhodotorula paludigena]|uniref:Wbp11/ELF5/Saf1 N-terminal domain-containing protein n=1 Tax=Rhodotorula paludigena TaxID=86838 RepID=A0AAV5G4C2_9BASI|nr:hypothetical protein Rhopal_000176-T1 [Rhodotorula paludigena]